MALYAQGNRRVHHSVTSPFTTFQNICQDDNTVLPRTSGSRFSAVCDDNASFSAARRERGHRGFRGSKGKVLGARAACAMVLRSQSVGTTLNSALGSPLFLFSSSESSAVT